MAINIHKPIIKWIGGKTQIIEEVLKLFPKEIKNYYEPFIGGGSVLFGLLSYIENNEINLTGKIYASDLNENLINMYINIQTKPRELIIELNKLVEEFKTCLDKKINRKPKDLQEALTSQESYYFWIRQKFNKHEDITSSNASAMLIFLNKTCFRGMYREGPNGFNVPFGNYKNPSIYDEKHILQISKLIKPVIFTHCSYIDIKVYKNSYVYLDPPYVKEQKTSFVGYTKDGFNNHEEFFQFCYNLNDKKIKFLMSNADVQSVKNKFLPPTYTTKIISCRRAINSNKPNSRTNEVLIYN